MKQHHASSWLPVNGHELDLGVSAAVPTVARGQRDEKGVRQTRLSQGRSHLSALKVTADSHRALWFCLLGNVGERWGTLGNAGERWGLLGKAAKPGKEKECDNEPWVHPPHGSTTTSLKPVLLHLHPPPPRH